MDDGWSLSSDDSVIFKVRIEFVRPKKTLLLTTQPNLKAQARTRSLLPQLSNTVTTTTSIWMLQPAALLEWLMYVWATRARIRSLTDSRINLIILSLQQNDQHCQANTCDVSNISILQRCIRFVWLTLTHPEVVLSVLFLLLILTEISCWNGKSSNYSAESQ